MEANRCFCSNCGTQLQAGDVYCGQCGASQESSPPVQQGEWYWDARIPAGDLLWTAAKVMMLACGFVIVLIEVIMWFSKESFIGSIGKSIARNDSDIYYAGGFIGFFFLISAIVIWLIYRHGYEAKFAVTSDGVAMETGPGTRKTNRVINGLLFWMSLLSGKPGGMGTAILADASQSGFFEWEDIHRIVPDSQRRIITLKNNWRSLVKLYCTPENYEPVLRYIEGYVRQYEPPRLANAASSPGIGGYALKLGRAAAIVLAVVLIGQSPLLPDSTGVVILGVLVVVGFITGGQIKQNITYLTAAVLIGLAISMAINAFEPMGDYLVRYYRYDRLTRMPEMAEFALSVAGMIMIVIATWRNYNHHER